MSFFRFLYTKGILLCLIAIGVIAWSVFAFYAGVKPVVIFITDFVIIAGMAACFAVEYFYIRKRLAKLAELCKNLEEGYLLGEVLPKPVNAVEQEYFTIMKTVSRSAIEKTEKTLRAQEAYSDYVESWIHEIKTPLTACSLILANGGDSRKLKTELKRAENLTESILYCARMRTIEADTQISKISVHVAVDEAVKSEMDLLLAANIGVDVEGDFSAYTDKKTLVFVLKQLLVNCSKYCPGCKVSIYAENGVISVEDNGTGIPSYELPRLFDRGFVGSAGRKYGGGTGMGLYLSHELCTRLGIELNVKSEESRFTRFSLIFPMEAEKNSKL